MTETKAERKERMKKSICLRWRRQKNLCERCGMDIHEGECNEDYSQTDMRNIPLSSKSVNLEKKKATILTYRRKKGLCERCGLEGKHIDCKETYEHSDMRPKEQKEKRPAIIETPKHKGPTILEEIEESKEITLTIKPNKSISLHRKFIVLNLFKSNQGDIVEFSCINQLSKKYQNHIICTIGKIDKHFPYSDVMKIRKLPNIVEIKPCIEQNIINHIGSCDKLFTFPSKLYTPICKKFNISIYEFPIGRNATNFLPDIAYRI